MSLKNWWKQLMCRHEWKCQDTELSRALFKVLKDYTSNYCIKCGKVKHES